MVPFARFRQESVTDAGHRRDLRADVGANSGLRRGEFGNFGQTNYAAAKAGIVGFTKSLAKELGKRNITVNAVAPGFIRTEMTRGIPFIRKLIIGKLIPLKDLGEAEDIANAVVFLASDKARYITGEVLHVSGGLSF